MLTTDVCIVGAGPAGATLSLFLTKKGIDHIIVDKASFPRDKVCGDGITIDVLHTLKRLSPDLLAEFDAQSEMLPCWGFCFHSPGNKEIRYDFKNSDFDYSPFYSTRRLDFDRFLTDRIDSSHANFLTETKVDAIEKADDGLRIKCIGRKGEQIINTKIVIGAEGEKPVVGRYLGLEHYREKQHLIGAIRVYYKGVQGFHENNHLEFFFHDKLIPGYFWAFPLNNNEANVGLGMVSTAISQKKVNLRKLLPQVIESHPRIKEMFAESEPIESPKGWGLPLITSNRQIAGNRFALIGDAGGMIEPFTGKGIGPGMVSARIISEHIEEALLEKNYDLHSFQDHMYRYYKNEIKTGYTLQKTLRYQPLLNTVVNTANWKPFYNWAHQKMVNEWKRWI